MTDDVIQEVVNAMRRDGMPEIFHSCVDTGAVHVPYLDKRLSDHDVQRVLVNYESVVVMDGHEKLNRAVCQHQQGERDVHPLTQLRVPKQCSGVQTPHRALCI